MKEALKGMLNGLSVSGLIRITIPEVRVKQPDGLDVLLREGKDNYGFVIVAASAKDTFETYRSWFDILREAKVQETSDFVSPRMKDNFESRFNYFNEYLKEKNLAPIESIKSDYLFPLLELGLEPSQIAQILELEPLNTTVSLNLQEFNNFVRDVSQKILLPIEIYNAELFRLLLIFFCADFTDVEQVCDYLEYREEYVDEVNRPEADRLHLKEIFQDWFNQLEDAYASLFKNVKGEEFVFAPVNAYPNGLQILDSFVENIDAKKMAAVMFDNSYYHYKPSWDYKQFREAVLLELGLTEINDAQEVSLVNYYRAKMSVEPASELLQKEIEERNDEEAE